MRKRGELEKWRKGEKGTAKERKGDKEREV